MALIKEVSFFDFEREFKDFDRMENFSYYGKKALYELLEEPEEIFELDVIALCCEWNEDTIENIINNFGIDLDGETEEDEIQQIVQEYLEDNTFSVFLENGNFLYAAF